MPTTGPANRQPDTYTDIVNTMLDDLSTMQEETGKARVSVKKMSTAKVGKDEVLFSKLWGVSPPSRVNRACLVYKDMDWPGAVRGFIPAPDPAYMVDAEAVEAGTFAIINNERAIAIGPTGGGKSHMWREICARLRIPFYRIQLHEELEYSAVFGMPKLSADGELTFAPGPIVLMAKCGGVLCLDEIYRANQDLNMSLQYVLEENGKIYLPDFPGPAEERLITPVDTFRVVATDNTEGLGDTNGRHVTGRRQDTAFLDRWTMTIRLPYQDEAAEIARVRSIVPTLAKADAKVMLKFTTLVRAAYETESLELTISPRTLVSWARKSHAFGDMMTGLEYAWYNKLPEDSIAEAKALAIKVFGQAAAVL